MPSKPKKEEKRSDPNAPFSVFGAARKLREQKQKREEAIRGPSKRTQ